MTLPPYSEEAERRVLGAVLSASALDCAAGWRILRRSQEAGLHPTDFYLPANAALFATYVYLAKRGSSLDPVSVAQALETLARKRLGKLGPWVESSLDWPTAVRGRLEQLAVEAISFSNIEHHARIVKMLARERVREAAKVAQAERQS